MISYNKASSKLSNKSKIRLEIAHKIYFVDGILATNIPKSIQEKTSKSTKSE